MKDEKTKQQLIELHELLLQVGCNMSLGGGYGVELIGDEVGVLSGWFIIKPGRKIKLPIEIARNHLLGLARDFVVSNRFHPPEPIHKYANIEHYVVWEFEHIEYETEIEALIEVIRQLI